MSDLKSYVDRISKAEDEKKDVQDFIKDIYIEAKSNGFDVKALRRVVKETRTPVNQLQTEEHIVDTYRAAVGISI